MEQFAAYKSMTYTMYERVNDFICQHELMPLWLEFSLSVTLQKGPSSHLSQEEMQDATPCM